LQGVVDKGVKMKFFFSKHLDTQTVPATESSKISDISTPFLVKTVASLLINTVTINHAESYTKDDYVGNCKPSITIERYLSRFFTYLSDEPSLYILFLVYLNKYLEMDPNHSLNEMNVHRLSACSLLLAYKQIMDYHVNNTFFAKVAGVSLPELNQLEIKFLMVFDFKAYVSTEELEECYHSLLDYAHTVKAEDSKGIICPSV
jgi:hypothetical protein